METITLKCACGNEIVTTRAGRAKRCNRCKTFFHRVYGKWLKRNVTAKEALEKANEEWFKSIEDGTIDKEVDARHHGMEVFPDGHRCVFCGKMSKHEFCRNCRANGFDRVYAVTHRSNGWDGRSRSKVSVEDGWRGQKVLGGKACDNRHKTY